jgi:hypothetical protein
MERGVIRLEGVGRGEVDEWIEREEMGSCVDCVDSRGKAEEGGF